MPRHQKNPRSQNPAPGKPGMESPNEPRPHQDQLEVRPQSRPTQIRLQKELLSSGHRPSKLNGEIVRQFSLGLLNAHHGILPKYRGNFCNRWALLTDDNCGSSGYCLDEGLETGPILQVPVLLRCPGEWLWDFDARVTCICAEAVVSAALKLLCGQIIAIP